MSVPALWGGVECTVNRVGDRYFDQLHRTGHQNRPCDLDAFATLGIEALRYPVLWERVERSPGHRDWRWSDARLTRLERLGLRPIVGLIHHGSGPRWTSLLDDSFAPGLAAHALATAQRYPWVRDWTPVNEPLTTARFSGLYGHWYPHRRDETALWTALLNQIEATVLSMKAIRSVIPGARLIQTEDFGHASGTSPCRSQVEFENERRWLTWDLLEGRVDRHHPLWGRLTAAGLQERLLALIDDPSPADLIGINHYVTSDRFLDHRLALYPEGARGGNGRMAYADVETVRVLAPGASTWADRLEEVRARYRRPMAVTECHLGGRISDRLAWLDECWQAAVALNTRDRCIEAVTTWSLAGAVDWDSLLTLERGHAEIGVFERVDGALRDTPVADLCRRLTAGDGRAHPVETMMPIEGWWRMAERVLYPAASAAA